MKLFFSTLLVFFSQLAIAQTEEICFQPIPEGWIIINSRSCTNCCGSESPNINRMYTIKKIDSLPVGTTLEICPNQPTPPGWVIVSIRVCRTACCGVNAYKKMPTIKLIPQKNTATFTNNSTFVNSIVSGSICNTFGLDQFVSNSDAKAAYTVTVKGTETTAGKPSTEFQKVVSVPAGGKTYLGCSRLGTELITTVTYMVIGESKE